MAAEDEAPPWAKAEIREAIRILKEDGLHIHKTYAAFQASLNGGTTTETGTEETETEGTPPPGGAGNEKPKRKGVWWGERAS